MQQTSLCERNVRSKADAENYRKVETCTHCTHFDFHNNVSPAQNISVQNKVWHN